MATVEGTRLPNGTADGEALPKAGGACKNVPNDENSMQDEKKDETAGSVKGSSEVGEYSEDGESERPVRKKLQQTSIDNPDKLQEGTVRDSDDLSMASQDTGNLSDDKHAKNNKITDGDGRGRLLKKKRSHDDLSNDGGQEDYDEESGHRRKRSRDSKSCGSPTRDEQIGMLKKKRSRDQFDKDQERESDGEQVDEKPEAPVEPSEPKEVNSGGVLSSPKSRIAHGEPEKKRHRDISQERGTDEKAKIASDIPTDTKAPTSENPKASTSTEDTKSKEQPSSTSSAFAASALAGFAGSDKSPFGAISGGTSAFASKDKPKHDQETATANSSTSPFAAPSSSSGSFAFPFGGSAFAKSTFASGFAAAAPKPGEKLSTFASPATAETTEGGFMAKPFGASKSDDGEEAQEDKKTEEGKTSEEANSAKEHKRFVKQATETGEEREETHFNCRAKLFSFANGEWKERGVGIFKLNVSESDKAETEKEDGDDDTATGKQSARFIMRAEGVLRVILNIPLYKGMKVGGPSGNGPTGKQVHISGIEDGRSVPLLLKTPNADSALDLYHVAQDFIGRL